MPSPSHKKLFVYEHLAERVTYHSLTGLIYWKEKPKQICRHWHFLKPAGRVENSGYSTIKAYFGGKEYRLQQHNLAWFIAYGELPKDGFTIDHKNDRKADNRLENLRLLSYSGQSIARQRGSDLPPWVFLFKSTGKFAASIRVLGKKKHLGYFNDSWEAHIRVVDFAIENGLICAEEYALLITEWKEFRGGKNG